MPLPYVPTPPLFAGKASPLLVMAAPAVLSMLVLRLLTVRYWSAAGRERSLDAGGGGLLSAPDFTGLVRGRRVRVALGAGDSTLFGGAMEDLIVEAELQRVAEDGVMLAPDPEQSAAFQAFEVAGNADVAVDEFVAVSNVEGMAEAVLTAPVQETPGRREAQPGLGG
jgi:hypothetical protein